MNITSLSPNDVRDLTDEVVRMVGRTMAGYACDVRNRNIIDNWQTGDSVPDDDQLERLFVCKEVFQVVASSDGPKVARSWFVGSSCGDDDQSPAESIRFGNYQDARASAARMAGDEQMGW